MCILNQVAGAARRTLTTSVLILLATTAATVDANAQAAGDALSIQGEALPINTALTTVMTDTQEHVTGDAAYLLRARKSGAIKPQSITLGAFFKGIYAYERTDTAGKYPILSRFPNQHGSGKENSDGVVSVAGVSGLIAAGDWLTGYVQAEYSETSFARDQDDVQLREYYVVIGNLDEAPVYGAIGRKTVDFGEQFGYNPFTHTINQHFFWTLADDPVIELGYVGDDWRVSGTLANGERMLRTGLSVERDGGLGTNFAVKGEKSFALDDNRALRVSASYLDESIYNNNFTAHTLGAINRNGPPNAPLPPAIYIDQSVGLWDVAAEYTSSHIDFAVEFTRSTNLWPATSYDSNTGAEFADARHLSAVSAMGRYKMDMFGIPTDLSAVFSRSVIGPEHTEFDSLTQHVVGIEMHLNAYIDVGAEIVFNRGFQPFVGIQDVSDRDVNSEVGIIGVKMRL